MKIPNNISEKEIKFFFKKIGLNKTLENFDNNKKINLYPPNLKDLYFIYKIIILNKRLKVLEFGTGFSSLIISIALKANFFKYKNLDFKEFGVSNPFSYHVVDDQKKFINISKKRIDTYSSNKICKPNFHNYRCELGYYENKICNRYIKLPNFIPDFIYLDGPDINMINNSIKGINFSKNEKYPPLSMDILEIEYLLNPGTIIVVDGRFSNSLFLKNNLQRNWKYKYNTFIDQHYFYLDEKKLGSKSKKLINFYNT